MTDYWTAYEAALPAFKALEKLLVQYTAAVESHEKSNRAVDEVLANAETCKRCRVPFVRVERPQPPAVVEHFGPRYGLGCNGCRAAVYPPPELHFMIRAEEFLKAAVALTKSPSSGDRHTHVILFLLYHAVELHLKCLGTYTYYIAETPVEIDTAQKAEDPEEMPDQVLFSHSLSVAFKRIPPSIQRRLVAFGKQNKTDIERVMETVPEAVGLYGRYPWIGAKHEDVLENITYSEDEVVSVLHEVANLLRSFAVAERQRLL